MSSLSSNYRLRIPDGAGESLQLLINLAPDEREAFFKAIASAQPALSPDQLSIAIRSSAQNGNDWSKLVSLLVSLMATRYRYELTAEKLAADVTKEATIKGLGSWQLDSAEANDFENYLQRLLALDIPLGATAKVVDVLIQHRNPFKSARILSDVRAVFASNDLLPLAAVIVHNLQVETRTGTAEESVIIALDTKDLRTLKAVIERALKKEDALKSVITKGGLKYIDVAY